VEKKQKICHQAACSISLFEKLHVHDTISRVFPKTTLSKTKHGFLDCGEEEGKWRCLRVNDHNL
jgi:hypothetical protein